MIKNNENKPQSISPDAETTVPAVAEEDESVYEGLDIDQPDSQFLKEVEVMLARLNQELFTLEEKT